jgi:hypothetical protein
MQIAHGIIPCAPSRRKTMAEREKLAHAVNPFC